MDEGGITLMRSNDSTQELIAGLDIASTKVSMVVASASYSGEDQKLEILASRSVPNTGLVKGTITSINETVEAISTCLSGMKEECGTNISSALIGISGDYIRSFDSKTTTLIHDSEIDWADIGRLKKEAKVISVPGRYDVIHVIPKSFTVDEEEGIINPEGMYGSKLEMSAHIITSRNTAIKNVVKCCHKANLQVESLVLSGLASSISVLGEDEKQLGVALVDIGGGTAKILIYVRGMLVHTAVVPIGGINLTNDVAVALRVSQKYAEELKCNYGQAMPSLITDTEEIEIKDSDMKKSKAISNIQLSEIIEPRAEEILSLISRALNESGFINNLGSGVVLTGGTSNLTGLGEMMEFLYNMKVRVGIPCYVNGVDDELRKPEFATGVGLVMYGFKNRKKHKKFFLHHKVSGAWKKIKGLITT